MEQQIQVKGVFIGRSGLTLVYLVSFLQIDDRVYKSFDPGVIQCEHQPGSMGDRACPSTFSIASLACL